MLEQRLEQGAKQRQTPPGETHLTHAAKHRALGALCLFGLGAALSACSSDFVKTEDPVTVYFDKNNRDEGSTEANPDSMTVQPPATTVGTLPTEPGRPGHRFVGWNMQSDGKGAPFTADTPVGPITHLVVYAKWEPLPPPPLLPRLEVEVVPSKKALTPLTDGDYNERSTSFGVVVSGFKSLDDANSVGLEISVDNASQRLSLPVTSTPTESTRTFSVTLNYDKMIDFANTEGQVSLRLTLINIPKGYEYLGGAQTLRIVVTDGLSKTSPIPVNQDNLLHFNNYARTDGLALHYRLMEDVELDPPVPPKTSNWTAIGTNSSFTGSFDGGGHSISGLIINSSANYQGLFGVISGKDAEIKNLGLKGGSISGGSYVGGVVGYNLFGRVQNCYAADSVSGASSVGGVVGCNYNGTVQNCYATGDVTGSGMVGGVLGSNSDGGKMYNSYATGSVTSMSDYPSSFSCAGGVVGYNTGGTVQNCYATGSVISIYSNNTSNSSSCAGGVVGRNEGAAVVQSCVALNPSVILIYANSPDSPWPSTPWRVAMRGNGTLTNNYARTGMLLIENGKPPAPSSSHPNSENGEDVSATTYGNSPFWKGLCSVNPSTKEEICWDFDNVWDWNATTQRPILRNVGGQ